MGAQEGLPAMDREPNPEEGLESRVLHEGPRAEGSVVLEQGSRQRKMYRFNDGPGSAVGSDLTLVAGWSRV